MFWEPRLLLLCGKHCCGNHWCGHQWCGSRCCDNQLPEPCSSLYVLEFCSSRLVRSVHIVRSYRSICRPPAVRGRAAGCPAASLSLREKKGGGAPKSARVRRRFCEVLRETAGGESRGGVGCAEAGAPRYVPLLLCFASAVFARLARPVFSSLFSHFR